MRIRHATPVRNLPSVRRLGLLTSKSQGKLPVVWLHTASKSSWAALHTVKRHGGRIERVVIIELEVPRSWLRRNRKRLWICQQDIPPACFKRFITFAELAGPSADEAPSDRLPVARLAG